MSFVPRYKGIAYLFPDEGADLNPHRLRVKFWLMGQGLRLCPGCGEYLGYGPHMHEGILSRRDVMGWPKARRVLIMTPYNCILLCPSCNWGMDGKSAPSRQEVLMDKCAEYGEAEIVRWLHSLPFKIHPLRTWLEER